MAVMDSWGRIEWVWGQRFRCSSDLRIGWRESSSEVANKALFNMGLND